MADKSQELAFALLKEAKEKGTLDPSIEAELAELIGTTSRPKVKEVLKTPVAAETEKREITPEQVDGLVSTLKSRFELPKNKKLRETLNWEEAEKALRANAEELLHLEETGGEPQIVGMEGDEYIIEDRSVESPSGRRDLNFDEADTQRASFGQNVRFQSPDSYKAMQKTGKYDLNSGSWLETDPEYRKRTGHAMRGYRDVDVVYVGEFDAVYHYPGYGWRASLRVKKV